jgi:hypothetical protein
MAARVTTSATSMRPIRDVGIGGADAAKGPESPVRVEALGGTLSISSHQELAPRCTPRSRSKIHDHPLQAAPRQRYARLIPSRGH